MMLNGKKVLVTGATGFIGGRLVERLIHECHVQVRVLVRNFSHVARIARFPLEMVQGNLTDTEAVSRAAHGCDAVFHCAYGSTGTEKERRVATVGGTEAVAKATLAAGVSRMVHISTISVYGRTPNGILGENSPRQDSRDIYACTKLEAEQLVLNYHRKHGLPVVVIQPTIVYGPFGGGWTSKILEQLKTKRIVLINGGIGLCNAVYVDDVVEAMILAASKKDVVGETFLISGEAPVTWKDFYGAYEKMLGFKGTVSISTEELRTYIRHQKKISNTIWQLLKVLIGNPKVRAELAQLPAVANAYRLIRFATPHTFLEKVKRQIRNSGNSSGSLPLLEQKPLLIPSRDIIFLYTGKTHVCIDKARRRLGYKPRFGLDRGMRLTSKWAGWANLL